MKNTIQTALFASILVTTADAQVDLGTYDPSARLTASTVQASLGDPIELNLSLRSNAQEDIFAALPGSYRYEPASNGWHSGTITHVGGSSFRWTNDAGVSWGLELDASRTNLLTGPDNPYYHSYPQYRTYPLVFDADGSLQGFDFAGLYGRLSDSSESLGIEPGGLVRTIWDVDGGWNRVFSAPSYGSAGSTFYSSAFQQSWYPVDDRGYLLPPGLYRVHTVHHHDFGPQGIARYDTYFYLRIEPNRIEASYFTSLGSGHLTGRFYTGADVGRWNDGQGKGLSANALAFADVNLFGYSVEAFRFEANGTVRTDAITPATCRGLARVGGYDVMNFDTNAPYASGSAGLYQTIVEAERTFVVAGYPITVEAEAGLFHGVSASVHANVIGREVTLTAGANNYMYSSGSCSVDFLIVSAGVYADLTLFETSLTFPLTVDLDSGLSSTMQYQFQPVSVEFGLFVEIDYWFDDEYYSIPLGNWSSPAIERTVSLY